MVTAFGKFCRKLRIDKGEVLKDMADKLNVKSSFLSAVELGKKSIPASWTEAIEKLYGLDSESVKALKEAVENSANAVKINLSGHNDSDRDLVLSFARRFDSLSSDEKDQLKQFFKNK